MTPVNGCQSGCFYNIFRQTSQQANDCFFLVMVKLVKWSFSLFKAQIYGQLMQIIVENYMVLL